MSTIAHIKDVLKRRYYLLMPLLMFLSFPSYDLLPLKFFPFFAWFALSPLMLYSRGVELKKLYPQLFGVSLIANFMTYGWMGSFGNTIPNGNIALLSVFIPTLSVILATKFFVCEALSRRYPRYRLLIYPLVWTLFDYLQSYGYLAFPWSYWGYTQYSVLPMIQSATLYGVFGITFAVILVNTAIAELMKQALSTKIDAQKPKGKSKLTVLILLTPFILLTFGAIRLAKAPHSTKSDMTFSLVQSCISPWEDWLEKRYDYLNELIAISNAAVKAKRPDMLIWSESATLETISYSYLTKKLNRFEFTVLEYAKFLKLPLLTAEIGKSVDYEAKRLDYTNSAALIDEHGDVVETYSKIHLAPIGEWFPYDRWFPGLRQYLESMGSSSFKPGVYPVMFETKGYKFGCLICYEGMFFRLNSYYKRQGADFLVNITNDGWSDYYNGHMQHYAASRFRAVENGIWFVRVGNTGYTVILDPYGREIKSIPILKPGYVNGSADFSLNTESFYSRYGDLLLILLTFVSLVLLVLEELRIRKRRLKKEANE